MNLLCAAALTIICWNRITALLMMYAYNSYWQYHKIVLHTIHTVYTYTVSKCILPDTDWFQSLMQFYTLSYTCDVFVCHIYHFYCTLCRLLKYFNGSHHLEEIMLLENIPRNQLLTLIDKFSDILVTCLLPELGRHWKDLMIWEQIVVKVCDISVLCPINVPTSYDEFISYHMINNVQLLLSSTYQDSVLQLT